MNREGKLLCFGSGGHSIDFGDGSHLSGYDQPETFDDWGNVSEGCIVLDKRPALQTPEGRQWVFSGPLVDINLPDDQIDACPDITNSMMAKVMMWESGNQFGVLAAMHIASKAEVGPLDRVSTKKYVQGWVERGARQGVIQDNGIVFWQ